MACISTIRYIIKNLEYEYSLSIIYKTAVDINNITLLATHNLNPNVMINIFYHAVHIK